MTTRARRRRRLLVLGLLPLLLVGAFATKVALMYLHVGAGTSAIDGGDPSAARDAYRANATANVLQTWVAPYDEGVAAYLQQDADGAVRLFEAALAAAPVEERCRVRTNLVLATEAQADATAVDDLSRARLVWLQARRELDPCLTSPDSPEQGTLLEAIDTRLAGKLTTAAEAQRDVDPTVQPDQPFKGKAADFADLTPAQQQAILERRNAEGRRVRDRDLKPAKPPRQPDPGEEVTYNW